MKQVKSTLYIDFCHAKYSYWTFKQISYIMGKFLFPFFSGKKIHCKENSNTLRRKCL